MSKSWIIPSLISLLLYGCWGFLGARASQLSNLKTTFFVSCIGTMIAGLIMIPLLSTRLDLNFPGLSFSMLTGLATGFGTLTFIYALQRGPAIPIVMITALYPVVTLILAILFLKEALSLKQGLGMIFSVLAIYFLTV